MAVVDALVRPSRDALVAEIARCPKCRSELDFTSGSSGLAVVCRNVACAYSREGFPVVGRWPALIAFEDSIISREALAARTGGSAIDRHSGLRVALRRAVTGTNPVAASNCAAFAAEVRRLDARPKVLVVGGGTKGAGMEALYEASDITVVSTDIYGSEDVAVIADGHSLPFADGAFQGVWIQAVLEHVLDPEKVVSEIRRVLAPGGVVYAETPFMQQVHEAAYDFTRFTRSGHRWLFRDFEEIRAGNVGGAGQTLVWAIRYFFRTLTRSDKAATVLTVPFSWLRLVDRVTDERYAADAANGVYFLGRRATSQLARRDMIDYYPGPRS